jgi:hypothetical protein
MALTARVKKLKHVLTPSSEVIVVHRFDCETDAQALAKAGDVGEHDLVVILRMWTECPGGRHTHHVDIKRWRSA